MTTPLSPEPSATSATRFTSSREAPDESVEDEVGTFDVSVIVVSWNVYHLLQACLQSILDTQESLAVEIIVIDNASADGTPELIATRFPDVHLVVNEQNLGFGPANNLGLAIARGNFVFFLNPDTVLAAGALSSLYDFLVENTGVAAVGPKLVFPDGTPQWVAARRRPSLVAAVSHALYLHRIPFLGERLIQRLERPYDLRQSQEVEAVSGAALFGRREVIHDVGGFDEVFLHTGEDVDLCLRLRSRGWNIFYLAQATVTHFGGQSSAQAWARSGAMGVFSMTTFFRRSHGPILALGYRAVVLFAQVPLMLVVGLFKVLQDPARGWRDFRERCTFARAVWTSRIPSA